jgi:hypothetical protein
MKRTIFVTQFDIPRFIDTIVDFCKNEVPTVPAHEIAFNIVFDNGVALLKSEYLSDEGETIGDTPLEWLWHGQTLFGHFTRVISGYGNQRSFEAADGTKWDEPDDDEHEELVHDLTNSEAGSYGFLIWLKGEQLFIQTAVMTVFSGECKVRAARRSGPFEKPIIQFVKSMFRKDVEK